MYTLVITFDSLYIKNKTQKKGFHFVMKMLANPMGAHHSLLLNQKKTQKKNPYQSYSEPTPVSHPGRQLRTTTALSIANQSTIPPNAFPLALLT
jgi:hypothetical protein